MDNLIKWNLHDVIIEATTNDATLLAFWQQSFASLATTQAKPALKINLQLVNALPAAPVGKPQFQQADLLEYYIDESNVIVHFPRYGQLTLDLSAGTSHGLIIPDALNTYGVLEDLIAISLSPHLKRKGMFLIHAFAAVYHQQAALFIGGIGAGKTTTGLSLLDSGWQLLSNDSPIIMHDGMVHSYPGVIAGYPETFARFQSTAPFATEPAKQAGRQKLMVPAESIWPDIWCSQAPIRAIFFPQIEGGEHKLRPLNKLETLQQLLPHAVEPWDKAMVPSHLAVLKELAEHAEAFHLHLGPDVSAIPNLIASVFA